ncbi:MAG: HEAT repeat domain-containing protein [Myxococcales bacterium]|nr:HEAT repeat domain-containing protein [Myxococcales bacterium]
MPRRSSCSRPAPRWPSPWPRSSSTAISGASATARAHPEHVAALRAGLAQATDADTLRLYLDALGNAADAGAHDALVAALDHADAHVRAAAAYGLRGLEGDDVDATLTRVASQDPAPEVRRRAEQALAVRARR